MDEGLGASLASRLHRSDLLCGGKLGVSMLLCFVCRGDGSCIKKPLAGAQKHIPGMPAWAAQDSGKGSGYLWQ